MTFALRMRIDGNGYISVREHFFTGFSHPVSGHPSGELLRTLPSPFVPVGETDHTIDQSQASQSDKSGIGEDHQDNTEREKGYPHHKEGIIIDYHRFTLLPLFPEHDDSQDPEKNECRKDDQNNRKGQAHSRIQDVPCTKPFPDTSTCWSGTLSPSSFEMPGILENRIVSDRSLATLSQ